MLQISCLESKKLELNALFSRFAIGPLKKGQGLTLGNSLRRVLLSDLSGIAISSVRIIDVNHEFSTIPDVKEDVIDILLNLKQIVLKGNVSEPVLARLKYCGPGIITAKAISLPKGIELVEPNQYIGHVTTNRVIEMELLIKSGQGYFIRNVNDPIPDKFLAIDAMYMPVTKVNFFIETSNINLSFDKESLILEVYTNGSLTPNEAVSLAADLLQRIFNSLKLTDSSSLPPNKAEEKLKITKDNYFDNVMIEELELSVRAFNCLKRANIHTLADLLAYSREDLLEFKNFGQKSADEVYVNVKRKFGKELS